MLFAAGFEPAEACVHGAKKLKLGRANGGIYGGENNCFSLFPKLIKLFNKIIENSCYMWHIFGKGKY